MEKKKTYEKQLAEYEKQKDSELEEMRDVAQAEKEGIKHKFEQTEKSIVTKRKDQPKVRRASIGGDRGLGRGDFAPLQPSAPSNSSPSPQVPHPT